MLNYYFLTDAENKFSFLENTSTIFFWCFQVRKMIRVEESEPNKLKGDPQPIQTLFCFVMFMCNTIGFVNDNFFFVICNISI